MSAVQFWVHKACNAHDVITKKALQVNKEKTIERGQAVRQTKGKCGVIYEANVTKISFPHNLFLDLALSSHHLSWPFCNIPFM